MSQQAVINKLERAEIQAVQDWDGSWKIQISKRISGLPFEVAMRLTENLTKVFKEEALRLKTENDNQTNLFEEANHD